MVFWWPSVLVILHVELIYLMLFRIEILEFTLAFPATSLN